MQPLAYLPKPSTAELEAAKLEPLYVESAKDVEAIFADMLPHFAGKETGENWIRREQSALKIRRLTRGNAPEDYLPQYTAAIKSMSDGLVKGCMSLRTTLCTMTCHCVQDVVRKLRHGLDPTVEVCELGLLLFFGYTIRNTDSKLMHRSTSNVFSSCVQVRIKLPRRPEMPVLQSYSQVSPSPPESVNICSLQPKTRMSNHVFMLPSG